MRIEEVKREYEEVLKELQNPGLISDWEKFETLTKRKAFLEKIIEKQKEIEELKDEIEENKTILSGKEDAELVDLAQSELNGLLEKRGALEKELEELLASDSKNEFSAVIIEIRAGTGGEEAAMFAVDLFRMYSKYAVQNNWKQKVLDSHQTDLGGYKEVIFELSGQDVLSKMQYEAGVHRVQRIPATEKSGRIHTSTASVAVLPKPKKAKIKIRPDDLKIDVYKSSGPGGQNVNKRETAVRITHLSTGLVVTSQTERNLLQNKENAMKILEARLLEMQRKKESQTLSGTRREQIKKAERADKIRTYNFPQDRVTDHRIEKSFHNIEAIMDGNLNQIIEAITK
ncbi:MAG: peptide chain release factor 1 [Candidatus Nealsonbacteria bacterium]|nr:peptide chain release factor 1 [Candidatus Nealsonbacteria bacterium]